MSKRIKVALAILVLAAAVATNLPWPSASTPSMMGYRALCPASPISTFMLLVAAAGTYLWATNTQSGDGRRD